MLINYREPEKRDGVGPRGTRPDAGIDLKAVRIGTGGALRTLHSEVLRDDGFRGFGASGCFPKL